MSMLLRQIGALVAKDFVAECREAHHLFSILLFGFLLLLLFSFALSVDPALMRKMAPGLFWLASFFSSVLTLQHSYRRETEDGQWAGLLLLGVDPKVLFLGKLLVNLAFIGGVQLLLLPSMAILFDLTLTWSLAIVLLLGSLGMASLGTFYAGVTAAFREGQVLLPLLLFPMMVPVLLAAVHATDLTLAHDLFGQRAAWLKLLIVFDTIFLLGSLLCADVLFEGA